MFNVESLMFNVESLMFNVESLMLCPKCRDACNASAMESQQNDIG